MQKETGKIVKTVFIFAAVLSLIIVCIYGITKDDWLKGILSGITLAMAMLPEEFPVDLTVFLALGAWRMSKKQVLTRRIAVVETLGAATVPCVDKTGTLTQNKIELPKDQHEFEFLGLIGLADPVRESVGDAIKECYQAGIRVVMITGDGVNDAPALKSAHIGVAMGERGTDVARESSDIVLLKDDFASIVAAVRLGRRIFDNLKKAMAYIISVHIPIAGISLIPVLSGWPVILYPVHILFLELIIDPACSIVFEQEKEEANTMQRPPRDPGETLFGKRLLFLSILQGLFSLAVITAVYKIALALNQSVAEARTLSFFALIISNLCLILTNRSWCKSIFASLRVPNQALKWVILGAILFLGLVIYVPFLQKMFHFAALHCLDVVIALIAGILSVAWFEIVKIMSVKKHIELLKD